MLLLLLRLRTYTQAALRFSDTHATLLWAAVAGVVGALATVGFREGIDFLQWLMVGQTGSLVDMAERLSWPMRLLIPACGGVVAGSLLLLGKQSNQKQTNVDYMEAIAIGDGHISLRQSLSRSISSLCTIASGGSIGREGSMIQLAALCSSLLGRVIHFDPPRLRLLVACGAAAGITAAYNAPIAGAFFITEIVLGSIAMESFGPILVASVIANITMRAFAGYRPPYEIPSFPAIHGLEVLLFLMLGLLAGLAAPPFLHLLDFSKRQFNKAGMPLPLRLGVGGLLVGLLSLWLPQIWGNGYEVVNSILHTHWAWTTLLIILVLKVLATALTTGSGAVGGVFTPTLFVGAVIGCLFGLAAHALWPQIASAPYAYAIVGMGAFLAAATNAPLMAMLMIFEMTLSYQVMLPLILSCVVAYSVSRAIDEKSMYHITIDRRRTKQEQLRLRAALVGDMIKPAETVLPTTATIGELTRVFLEYPVKYIYIVDAAQRFCGAVALKDITSNLLDAKTMEDQRAGDFLRHDLHSLTPDMSLAVALKHFMMYRGERLPVVKSAQSPILLGVVYKSTLLDTYVRMSGVS
jgi:CIC family chloride channel protein